MTDPRIIEARRLLMEVTKEQRAKRKKESDNTLCMCGHKFKDHSIRYSVNYTAGMCGKCDCQNYLETNKK